MNKYKYLSKEWFMYEKEKHNKFINNTITIVIMLIVVAILVDIFRR